MTEQLKFSSQGNDNAKSGFSLFQRFATREQNTSRTYRTWITF